MLTTWSHIYIQTHIIHICQYHAASAGVSSAKQPSMRKRMEEEAARGAGGRAGGGAASEYETASETGSLTSQASTIRGRHNQSPPRLKGEAARWNPQRGFGFIKPMDGGVTGGRRDNSHGLMPWAKINGEWYFLVQAGYSSKRYDFKIDPLRGQREPEEDKTPWQTAVRECREESGVLRLRFVRAMVNLSISERCQPTLKRHRALPAVPPSFCPACTALSMSIGREKYCN